MHVSAEIRLKSGRVHNIDRAFCSRPRLREALQGELHAPSVGNNTSIDQVQHVRFIGQAAAPQRAVRVQLAGPHAASRILGHHQRIGPPLRNCNVSSIPAPP